MIKPDTAPPQHHSSAAVAAPHASDRELARTAGPGRRSLVESTWGGAGSTNDLGHDPLRNAQQIVSALRTSELPRFEAALALTDVDPISQQLEVMRAAQRVQYALAEARHQLMAAETAGSSTAPANVLATTPALRSELESLRTTAIEHGVFRSVRELVPGPANAASSVVASTAASTMSNKTHLDRASGGSSSAQAAERPVTASAPTVVAEASLPPLGDGKHAIRRVFEVPLADTKLGRLTFQARWEISGTRAGQTNTKAGPVKVKLGASESIFASKVTAEARTASHKFGSSLAKLEVDFLEKQSLTLAGVPIALKIETKFLDAGLSIDKVQLDAMKVTAIGEGDFSAFVPSALKSTMQLRIELAVPAELAQHLFQLAQASKHLERAAKIEQRFGVAKRRLANRKKLAGKLAKQTRMLSTIERRRLLVLQREIEELEGKVGKIGKLREVAIKARGKAIQVVQATSKKLGKTALGRVISTAAGKALGLALKRFLPIYNSIQLAADLYAVGSFLVNADWSKLGDGRAGFGSGDKDSDGDDGDGDAGDGGDGAGTGIGDDGDANGGDAGGDVRSIEIADLAEPAPVELTPVAERVAGSVGQTGAGVQALDADAKEIINRVVPADLTPAEIEDIAKRMAERRAGSASRPLAEAVIDAIQYVRPDGKPRPRPAATPLEPAVAPQSPAPVATSRPLSEPPRMRSPATATRSEPASTTSSRIVDVRGYLRDHATIDHAGKVTVPMKFNISGVEFHVTAIQQARSVAMEDYMNVHATLSVLAGPPRQMLTTSGVRLTGKAMEISELIEVPLPARANRATERPR